MFDMLQKLICFSLEVHIWSGRRKLSAADLNLHEGDIPPEELASLGVKKICDPMLLTRFQALRRRAERTCELAGVRFLGGYAIPQEKADSVARELEQIAADFMSEKETFLKNYSEHTEAWLTSLPDKWREMVVKAIESPEYVARRISFAHQTFQVQGVEGFNDGLEKSVKGLGSQLFKEIAKSARQTWESSFKGRTKVSQKALRPIRATLEKARGLSFLDGTLAPVIDGIEEELNSLPKTGYLEGKDFHVLVGVLNSLTNLDGIKLAIDTGQNKSEEEDSEQESLSSNIEEFSHRPVEPVVVPVAWF